MKTMRLEIDKQPAKELRRMQPKTADAIMTALESIAADPFAPHPNVSPVKDTKDGFRLRHGGWRAVYHLDRQAMIMRVSLVRPRGGAYKGKFRRRR